jgi:hypothetical protein
MRSLRWELERLGDKGILKKKKRARQKKRKKRAPTVNGIHDAP